MKRILVIGATGFTGRHLVERLQAENDVRIIGVGRSEPTTDLYVDEFCTTDLLQPSATNRLFRHAKPDLIFNLAGARGGPKKLVRQTNVTLVVHLLEAIRKFNGYTPLVLIGSAAEYGKGQRHLMPLTEEHALRPSTWYGWTKALASRYALRTARRYNRPITVMRPFNLLGPGIPKSLMLGGVMDRLLQQLKTGRDSVVLKVGNLDSQRDFLDVRDAVDGYVRAVDSQAVWGEAFNICSGTPRSVRDVINVLLDQIPVDVNLEVDPSLLREGEVPCIFGSYGKANDTFGFEPRIPMAKAVEAAWLHAQKERG